MNRSVPPMTSAKINQHISTQSNHGVELPLSVDATSAGPASKCLTGISVDSRKGLVFPAGGGTPVS